MPNNIDLSPRGRGVLRTLNDKLATRMPTMQTAQRTTIVEHGQLIDGTGAAAIADGRGRRDGRIVYAAAACAGDARPTPHGSTPAAARSCRAGRGAFSSDLFRRGRAARPGHQVSRRIRHAAGGGQCAAGARVRLHGGAQRRQPVQYRRLAEEGDRGRPDRRARGWPPAAARFAAPAG